MSITINSLFPTAVGFTTFEEGFTKKQKNFILNLEKNSNAGNLTSKDRYLHKNKILTNFYNFCSSTINKYFKEIYQPKHDVNLRITQMWANYTEKNQYHHAHEHPNSFLSAVFYLQCTNGEDKIYFNRRDYKQLEVYSDSVNQFNCRSWFYPVEENLLIIFPSHINHSVEEVKFDKPRISISMNTFPVGKLGDYGLCTECILK
jgi:uncharacterized protein (TIGR02466 family)